MNCNKLSPEKDMVDWERIQASNGVIFCNFSELEGCGDCRYRVKCELREV